MELGTFGIYTVAFFGHRYIDKLHKVEKILEEYIQKLVNEKTYVDFLVGRNGEFDLCASSAVYRVQKNHRSDNSALVLVLPYPTAEYLNNEKYFREFYADIDISYTASISHPKSAIQIRNREMVDRADLIICYIKECRGGAYQTIKYAERCNKRIINIYDDVNEA